MRAPALRIESRRSVAPVLGVLLVVLGVGMVFALSGPWWKGGGAWDQQWTGLALWQRHLLQFLLPVTLGCGGWHGLRDRRSRIGELLGTTSRPGWQRSLTSAGALGIWVSAGYLAYLVVGGIRVAAGTGYFHLGWLPIAAVGVLALLGSTWLGVGIGRALPSLVTPPLLALAGLAAAALGAGSDSGAWLLSATPSGRTRDAFTTMLPEVTVLQLVWFAALTVTGVVLMAAARRLVRMTAVLPTALAAVVILPLLPADQADAYVIDPDASALVCAAGTPRVCVSRAHSALLGELTGPARDALAKLSTLPGAPTEVRELIPGRPMPPTVLPVNLESPEGIVDWRGDLGDPGSVRFDLLRGAGTVPCRPDTWGESFWRDEAARAVAAGWLDGALRMSDDYPDSQPRFRSMVRDEWGRLRALPDEQQRERILALQDAARSCDGDLLARLRGSR